VKGPQRLGLSGRRGWTRLGLAGLATLVLAAAVGFAADLVAGQVPDTTLRLKSISTTQLDQLGIRLTATRPPPYCALSDAVDDHGWAQGGLGGCPISRQAAEKAAMTGGNVTVLESALARATMPQNKSVGQSHLVWVVVLQGNGPRLWRAAPSCTVGTSSLCIGPRLGGLRLGGPRLVLLDGQTGTLLYGSWAGGVWVGPIVPRTVPVTVPRSGGAPES
jgi:hypothetical protein